MVLDVEVVAENPEIEDSLNRKGLYGINENEMLTALDAGMRQGAPEAGQAVDTSKVQILLGLEPAVLAIAMSSVDETDIYWAIDTHLNQCLQKFLLSSVAVRRRTKTTASLSISTEPVKQKSSR